MNFAVLCDFDGTVVMIDTVVFLLEKFAGDDWKRVERQYERGAITLEECMRTQFSMLRAPKDEMLKALEKAVIFRPNFDTLVEYCRRRGISLVIVSAGLDFVITHFLKLKGWNDFEVYVAETRFTVAGLTVTFSNLLDDSSVDFKEDVVTHYKRNGCKVLYIGDGTSDFSAARQADYAFAIKNSQLGNLCKLRGIPHKEITDFLEVVNAITRLAS